MEREGQQERLLGGILCATEMKELSHASAGNEVQTLQGRWWIGNNIRRPVMTVSTEGAQVTEYVPGMFRES